MRTAKTAYVAAPFFLFFAGAEVEPIAAEISATPDPRTSPGRAFADTTRAFFADGLRLAAVELSESERGPVRLALAFHGPARSEGVVLEFPAEGGQPTAFNRIAAAQSAELRVYRQEAELRRAIESGELRFVEFACGEYVLLFGDRYGAGGVAIDPLDYYVVRERAVGKDAHKAAARAFAESHRKGMQLVGLERPTADAAELFFARGDEEQIVFLVTDAAGEISSFELRTAPAHEIVRQYQPRAQARLAENIGKSDLISARWLIPAGWNPEDGDGDLSIRFGLGNGRAVEVSARKFGWRELECPC